MYIVAPILIFVLIALADIFVIYALPYRWFRYRIIKEGEVYTISKKLKLLGFYWIPYWRWCDEYSPYYFDTYKAAEQFINNMLRLPPKPVVVTEINPK